MARKNESPPIITNATGAGYDEPIFKKVGSVKMSSEGGALNLHFFEGSKYYSIPITDVRLILYEHADGKEGTIGAIREYNKSGV
jgi:hypothetical protein